MPWEEEFTERVMGYNVEPQQLTVFFDRHAAIFRLPLHHPEYEAIRARIAKACESGLPVRVTTLGQEIVRVEKP